MKNFLASTALLCSSLAALGQGTVQFSNITLYKISTSLTGDLITPLPPNSLVPTTGGFLEYGLFYGIGQSTSLTLLTSQFGVNSTTGAGLIANPSDSVSALNLVSIPGTTPNETDVWIQVQAWSGQYGTNYAAARAAFLSLSGPPYASWGQSDIVNVNGLGATLGPGVAIWQASTGTNPHFIRAFSTLTPIPEPSLVALAGAALLTLAFRKGR
jgi:hypothetical protein